MTTITPKDVTGSTTIQATEQVGKQLDTSNGAVQATSEVATEEALSPKFAALAKQHKLLRQQQRFVEEQKKQMEARSTEWDKLQQEASQAKTWKERLVQDPYGVMLESGLTADQVASLMLNQPNPSDQKLTLLERELKATKEELALLRTGQEESQSKLMDAAIKRIQNSVKTAVAKDESFEAIRAHGEEAELAVVELIKETFKEQGYEMPIEEALKDVEEFLIEEASKFAALKKVQAKLAPPVVDEQAQKITSQTQKPQMQTLSNRMVQSATKPSNEKERRQRAILAFQGKLA